MASPLPDEQWSGFERAAAGIIAMVGVLATAALLLSSSMPDNILTTILNEYFLGPVLAESSADAGYNTVNTVTYSVLLILFVIALSAWLRSQGMPHSDRAFIALFPWIAWAALGEVVEDAGLFGPGYEPWFVSPGIHFHTAGWVVVAAAFAHGASRTNDGSENEQGAMCGAMTLVALQAILMIGSFDVARDGTAIQGHFSLMPVVLCAALGLLLILAIQPLTEGWTSVERGVFQVGIGGSLILFGALVGFGQMVTTADSLVLLNLRHDGIVHLWIALPILIVPLALTLFAMWWGKPAATILAGSGLTAGVLPQGISLDDWEELRTQAHDLMERLAPRAILASPLVALAMMGEVVDGLATYIGLDHFGYTEKHVASAYLIELFDTALTFVLVKVLIAGVVWWFFAVARFEHRQRHLRLLIGLAILVVGLAPGLRDLGRMMLGV